MPPHCDTMDGPVVKAAIRALEAGNVELVLPFAYKEGEEEIREAFKKAMAVRDSGPEAHEVAGLYFFETVVRVHRAGEGAPYNGLKPAGLSHGPVVPVAEKALDTENPEELLNLMTGAVKDVVGEKFKHVMELKKNAPSGLDASRAYTLNMLGFQVYCHKLYMQLKTSSQEHHHE